MSPPHRAGLGSRIVAIVISEILRAKSGWPPASGCIEPNEIPCRWDYLAVRRSIEACSTERVHATRRPGASHDPNEPREPDELALYDYALDPVAVRGHLAASKAM